MNTDRVILLSLMIPVLLLASAAEADREPVLSQITAPHNYYFREMYLPRVTTGPSSPAWMPSGRELVYSMQGSIWRQSIDSETAVQITDGDGYDSQPDVAPDGRRVVFSRYDGQSVELFVLDLVTGNVTALTNDGNVNVDPRWSPDGESIAFVSTRADGRFRVFAGRFERGAFIAKPLREQRKSNIDRYYYSSYDHELSPAWLPEGNGLVLIANPEAPYGTGSLWLQDIAGGTPATMVQREETSWKAQPDVAPDGKRVAYASYLGQQWHQLWVTRVSGEAEPFPLTYGEFDVTEPRWSPDGERIAYVINESGNTSIRIQEFVGGRTIDLEIATYRHLVPHGQLELQIVDNRDQPVAARVSVIASDGRSYAPPDSWMHADDGFDRDVATFETHYFHSRGQETLALPAGPAAITVWRGLESHVQTRRVKITAGGANRVRIKTRALDLPSSWSGWQSGDVHVHMNYGGTYRNTPDNLAAQAGAEDLDFVFNLIVNKEQRIPDIAYFTPRPDPVSNDRVVLLHSQEFHTSHWGHQGLNSHLLIPDYAAYPYTAAASLYPDNATIAKLAREQGALVGYVHPFDPPAPDPRANPGLSNALPVDAALGLVDYYEVVGFADPHVSASVWYRLMNCGLRVAAAGGTDAMANYASLRGPVGVNRSYVKADDAQGDPAARRDAWLQALQRGRSFATNGPLLGFSVAGHEPGDALDLEAGSHELNYSGFMRSAFQVDHVEVVFNGEVVDSVPTAAGGLSASIDGSITLDESGWLLLRAWSESSDPLLFDLYPYATTTPVWVTVDGRSPASREDAEYFIDWIDRLRQTAARHPDYNSENERTKVLAHIDAATTRFEKCRQ